MALPPLLDRLSKTENAEPPDEDYIDVDYWADPGAEHQAEVRGARRDLGGDRGVLEGGMADAVGGIGYG
jgi:hypothetical protein